MRASVTKNLSISPVAIGPVYSYIGGIPVDRNPLYAFNAPSQQYVDALQAYLGITPDRPKIAFNDDVWDFGKYFISNNPAHLRIKFGRIPEGIRDSVKFYCIYRMLNGAQVETIQSEVCVLGSFFVRVRELFPEINPYALSAEMIKEVTESWKSRTNFYKPLFSLYHLYSFISVNENLVLNVDFKKFNRMLLDASEKSRQAVNYRKTPNIPEIYVRRIERVSLDVLRDTHASFNMRVTAGYLIFSMWTGLRSSELASLKSDALYSEKVNHGKDDAFFIYYSCSKKSRTNHHEYYQSSFCPELAVEAFKTIVELKKNNRLTNASPYLFNLLDYQGHLINTPICSSSISTYVDVFFTKYLKEECRKEWDGIAPHKSKAYIGDRTHEHPAESISVPTPTQFRVHLCSYFYSHGVDLPFIEINMGHMSCEMAAYYYRKEDETHQKELKTAQTFLKNIIANNYEPIGVNGSAIKNDIKTILSRTKYDIYKDIEEMAAIIGKRYIIRAKLVGVCVKLAPTTCATDDVSDKMLCAYGYCKNILHFFYMLDLSYASFKRLIQSYQVNLNGNHINAAQHELKRIKDHIKIRLEPEIEQLEKEIVSKGTRYILSEHPQLKNVVANLDDIKSEIIQWKTRTK